PSGAGAVDHPVSGGARDGQVVGSTGAQAGAGLDQLVLGQAGDQVDGGAQQLVDGAGGHRHVVAALLDGGADDHLAGGARDEVDGPAVGEAPDHATEGGAGRVQPEDLALDRADRQPGQVERAAAGGDHDPVGVDRADVGDRL